MPHTNWILYAYLDYSISNDDGNLEIPGYDLFRAEHPSNTKRGGVCIYYRNSLPLKILNIQYLHECIKFEIRIGGKLRRFVSLYRRQANRKMILNHLPTTLNLILK